MKKLLLFIFLCSECITAQTIPASRITDWSIAGYNDSFPDPANITDVTTFGATGDSITDNTSHIQAAITSLNGQRGVIYFPPGKFLVTSTIDLPDSVIIRGASCDSTSVIFNFNGVMGNGFNITGSLTGSFVNVTAGAIRGSQYVIVDDTASLSGGGYAELVQTNGAWDTDPVVWADNSIGQILNIVHVSGDTLFFDTPLRIDYDMQLNPRIRKFQPAKEVGIECMQILRVDTSPSISYNVFFNYAANCWMRGVESSLSVGSHVEIDGSTDITITGCYFHHAHSYDGVSTHGYGITLFNHSGQCLLTNNIMYHLRHSFSLQTGANGNVISYNYSLDPFRTEVPAIASADISLHGHYPFMNLFEGNIVQNIQVDQAHGPNGPYNTFFRNRIELFGLIMTAGAVESDSQNFVGNEIPNTQPFMGNYVLAGSGHFEYANNVRGTITPPGAVNLNDSSYYLSAPPSFWQSATFPSIGMPNVMGTGSIPSKDRYAAGIYLASCDENIPLKIPEMMSSQVEVFPNPSFGAVNIRLTDAVNSVLEIVNANGRKVFSGTISTSAYNVSVNEMNAGIYLVRVISAKGIVTKKIMIVR